MSEYLYKPHSVRGQLATSWEAGTVSKGKTVDGNGKPGIYLSNDVRTADIL